MFLERQLCIINKFAIYPWVTTGVNVTLPVPWMVWECLGYLQYNMYCAVQVASYEEQWSVPTWRVVEKYACQSGWPSPFTSTWTHVRQRIWCTELLSALVKPWSWSQDFMVLTNVFKPTLQHNSITTIHTTARAMAVTGCKKCNNCDIWKSSDA